MADDPQSSSNPEDKQQAMTEIPVPTTGPISVKVRFLTHLRGYHTVSPSFWLGCQRSWGGNLFQDQAEYEAEQTSGCLRK
jgi:hypothetical protein